MSYGWMYNDSPFPGYDLVVSDDSGDPYNWSLTDVYHKDGKFYTYSDAGCSCNGPYEGASEADLYPEPSFQEALKGLSTYAIEQALAWERSNR